MAEKESTMAIQEQPTSPSDTFTGDMESIVESLMVTASGSEALESFPHNQLPTVASRELFLNSFMAENEKKAPENQTPTPRLFEILTAVLEKPIENLDFRFVNTSGAALGTTFNPQLIEALDKLEANSSDTLRTLRMDMSNKGPWLTANERSILSSFKSLQQLRLPSFIFHPLDFDLVTQHLSSLVTLECNLHITLSAGDMVEKLKRLVNLREFYFDVLVDWEFKWHSSTHKDDVQKLSFPYSRLCTKLCPNLTVVGCVPTLTPSPTRKAYPRLETRICHVLDSEDAADKLVGKSKLEHLVVTRRMHPAQVLWHSENVVSLCVVGMTKFHDWYPLVQLKNLKVLYTIGCSPSGGMALRVAEPISRELTMQKYSLLRIANDNSGYYSLLQLIQKNELVPRKFIIPSDLSTLTILDFFDLPNNYDRLVEVFTAKCLQKIKIAFNNLDKCSLAKATDELRDREDVAPSLLFFEITAPLDLSEANRTMLAAFYQVICGKAKNLQKFYLHCRKE
ncbi:Hypothetical predicted protein [Cloeon dipterum]|uniref:Uncharacterized protein n=1 Tax=Cloeon dipterum TaxID=197152 RepID=A0A8S1CZQ2_9INSE|nr:Hypothetical predicted protein [Cloeon dipterum]